MFLTQMVSPRTLVYTFSKAKNGKHQSALRVFDNISQDDRTSTFCFLTKIMTTEYWKIKYQNKNKFIQAENFQYNPWGNHSNVKSSEATHK